MLKLVCDNELLCFIPQSKRMVPDISKVSSSSTILILSGLCASEIWAGEGQESRDCEHFCYLCRPRSR